MKTFSGSGNIIAAIILAMGIVFSTVGQCLAQSSPASQPAAAASSMTWQGWLLMMASWAAIISLFVFCLCRTLRRGGQSADATRNGVKDDSAKG